MHLQKKGGKKKKKERHLFGSHQHMAMPANDIQRLP